MRYQILPLSSTLISQDPRNVRWGPAAMSRVSVWKFVTGVEGLCMKGAEEWLLVEQDRVSAPERSVVLLVRRFWAALSRQWRSLAACSTVQVHFDNSFYIFISLLLQI